MQKIRKILRAVSEKTVLPTNQPTNQLTNQLTNQPTNYYQQHRFYRTWLTSVQKQVMVSPVTFPGKQGGENIPSTQYLNSQPEAKSNWLCIYAIFCCLNFSPIQKADIKRSSILEHFVIM